MLTSTRTGDRSTGITRNDVTVSIDTGVTHRFYVTSDGREHDVLQIAEAAVSRMGRVPQRQEAALRRYDCRPDLA